MFNYRITWWLLAVALFLWFAASAFGSTKVGNGDDGVDLEGARPIHDGPLVDSRDRAVTLLENLGVRGIRGLGDLLPEVAHADLYLAERDVSANLSSDQGTYHSNFSGLVYARTFAVPHAATRFFPVATNLSPGQMAALHIHEALHRALPPSVREDEAVVAAITLAITSPDSTHDRLEQVVRRYVSENDVAPGRGESLSPMGQTDGAVLETKASPPSEEDHFKQPSSIGYVYRQFWKPTEPATYPISRMHVIESDLYPFGGKRVPIGLGLQASLIDSAAGNQTGPLGISARARVWSRRDFNIGVWGQASLNVLSAEELKNSPYGRDVFTLGVSMRKDLRWFYVENYLSYDFQGTANQTVGLVTYHYDYGGVIDAKVRAGVRIWRLDVGAFGELHLADYFRVSGGAFGEDFGRYRILSAGPEITFATEDFAISILARYLLDSTQGASFDTLGNLMGPGVSQGSIGASAKVFF